MHLDDVPQSVGDWLTLGNRYRLDALLMKRNKQYASCWRETGFAVECFLKAAIMSKERWNRFPSRESRPDLYTHDLRRLLELLSIDLKTLHSHPVAPKLNTVLGWKRSHGYNPTAMSEKYASAIFEAAFDDGVVEWLVTTYRLNY